MKLQWRDREEVAMPWTAFFQRDVQCQTIGGMLKCFMNPWPKKLTNGFVNALFRALLWRFLYYRSRTTAWGEPTVGYG